MLLKVDYICTVINLSIFFAKLFVQWTVLRGLQFIYIYTAVVKFAFL